MNTGDWLVCTFLSSDGFVINSKLMIYEESCFSVDDACGLHE